MRILIVGAGLSGLACADRLSRAGHRVTLVDKGRGVGGRMASRRLATERGEVTLDHGAQYFTASDARFDACVRRWQDAGTVAHWPAAGEGAWVGAPTMNAPLKTMAEGLDVHWSTKVNQVSRHQGGWEAQTDAGAALQGDRLVIALPAEQAGQLLTIVAPEWSNLARASPSSPCWTIMLVFSESLPGLADYLRGDSGGILGSAARNSAKPGRTGPEAWVLQACAKWSADNLEASALEVEHDLLAAFSRGTDGPLPSILARSSHRWRYAQPVSEGPGPLWDARRGLGLCGDWLATPGVEGAWLSGDGLAGRMLD
ncbi:NAD(P)/FAD-dependent oxidoreductase [Brevundimonas sp.]